MISLYKFSKNIAFRLIDSYLAKIQPDGPLVNEITGCSRVKLYKSAGKYIPTVSSLIELLTGVAFLKIESISKYGYRAGP